MPITALAAGLVMSQAPAPAAVAAAPVTRLRVVQGVRPLAIAAAPTGSRVAVTLENNNVIVFDAATRQTVKTLTGHPQSPYAVAWSPDGRYIATGDESARIFLWDTRTWQRVREIRMHQRGIQALSFNGPGTLLMSTGKDDAANIYNVANGRRVGQVLGQGANLYSANFHPRADTFLVGTLATGSRLYRTTPAGVKVLNFLTGHDGRGVLDIEWNRAATLAASAGRDNNVILWDPVKLRRLGILRGHQDWVVHVAFSPNGRLLASSSTDRTVNIYNTASRQRVATLLDQSGIGAPVAFTGDGRFLVSVSIDDFLQVNAVTPPQAAPAAPATKPAPRRGRRG